MLFRSVELSEAINARLEYFKELEHATRMLNHPGESLVLQADFLDMVERVDVCIEFLRAHVSIWPYTLHPLLKPFRFSPSIMKLRYTSYASDNASPER